MYTFARSHGVLISEVPLYISPAIYLTETHTDS